MSSTLSRKYRPQIFADVVNQQHIKLTLQNEITRNVIAHAYLFSGPRGIGKTTLARIFAKSVNCGSRSPGSAEPCNTCLSCTSTADGRNLDVIEIDAASHTGVENVRGQIIETARFTPHGSLYKVYIIDEVHMLSTSAFNALLKTMEEPPLHAVFILATTEVHKVPDTIISRCQRFDFHKCDPASLVRRLEDIAHKEGYQVDEQVLKTIVARSGGYIRDAESALAQLFGLGESLITQELAELILPKGNQDAVRTLITHYLAQQKKELVSALLTLQEEGVDMEQVLDECTRVVRDLLIYQFAGKRTYGFEEYFGTAPESLIESIEHSNKKSFVRLLTHLIKAFEYQRVSPIPALPLELAFLTALLEHESSTESSPKPTPRGLGTPLMGGTLEPMGGLEWNAVIAKASTLNHSLHLTLKGMVPRGIIGNVVVLETGYELFQKKLEHPETKLLIEQVFSEALGKSVRIKIEKTTLQELPKEENAEAMLTQVMENFGGRVV